MACYFKAWVTAVGSLEVKCDSIRAWPAQCNMVQVGDYKFAPYLSNSPIASVNFLNATYWSDESMSKRR
jgi:hypothetical protein